MGLTAKGILQTGHSGQYRGLFSAVEPPRPAVISRDRPLPPGCKAYSQLELRQATGSFSVDALLGEGGFGKVFRGALEDGTSVAIKVLDRNGLQASSFHVCPDRRTVCMSQALKQLPKQVKVSCCKSYYPPHLGHCLKHFVRAFFLYGKIRSTSAVSRLKMMIAHLVMSSYLQHPLAHISYKSANTSMCIILLIGNASADVN